MLARRKQSAGQFAVIDKLQGRECFCRSCSDGNIRLAGNHELRDLGRTSLQEGKFDFGVYLDKTPENTRKNVVRKRKSCRNDQFPFVAFSEFTCNSFDVIHLTQYLFCNFDDSLPGLGHFNDPAAVADKQVHPEFLLKQADLLADTRLGGMK